MISYIDSMKNSKNFDIEFFKNNKDWLLMESLYNKNYINGIDKYKSRIPKKIHQVWIGSEIPECYNEIRNTWIKYHPDWEYKLWTENDIEELDIINKEQYKNAKNPATKSDILRYEILYRYGGIYVDTDFECIRNFEDLLYLDFFTSVGYDKDVIMYIGIIGSVAGNKIMKSCIDNMSNINDGNWFDLFNSTGPYYFTKNFMNTISINDNVVSFPITFFYPYPNSESDLDPEYVKTFIKNESYAIHQWHVSWGSAGAKKIIKIQK